MEKIQTYLLNGIFFFLGGGGSNTVLFILPPLESKWQSTLNSLSSTSRRQNFRPQIFKNVKSKLPYSTFLAPCALNFFRVAANF